MNHIKHLEMPDDSQAGRILTGDIIELNTDLALPVVSGKLYGMLVDNTFTLRRIYIQDDGSWLLHCKSEKFPNETIKRGIVSSQIVFGLVTSFQGDTL